MLPAGLAAALQHGARAVIITPRGQNPTGAALDAARAGELARVMDEQPRLLVIEDDHLGPVAGSALHTTVGARARWAATRSVAKALGPDLRLAVLAGDPETVARVQGRQQCGPGWVSHVLQDLVVWLSGDRETHALIDRARDTYAERRGALLRELARLGIEAHGASGLNVWVPVQDEAGAIAALLQRGWVLAPGAPFRLGGGPAVRVTIATLLPEEARQLARELASVIAPGAETRSG